MVGEEGVLSGGQAPPPPPRGAFAGAGGRRESSGADQECGGEPRLRLLCLRR